MMLQKTASREFFNEIGTPETKELGLLRCLKADHWRATGTYKKKRAKLSHNLHPWGIASCYLPSQPSGQSSHSGPILSAEYLILQLPRGHDPLVVRNG
jgi:hypothetical protein